MQANADRIRRKKTSKMDVEIFRILVICVLQWMLQNETVLGIEPPFISAWTSMQSDGTSPITISHPLGVIPAKVDVQVKVTHEGKEYIFPGMGSAQRDDDIDAEYGGVGYLYNEFEVKIYVPVSTNSRATGRVITTGGGLYVGPFLGTFSNCDVRVRAWSLSDWPTPSFVGSAVISTSSPYIDISHGLGAYPDFVIVQLTLSTGYVSEAQGITATSADHSTKWINSCGTIFGITDTSVTLWATAGADDFVACFKDGWGAEDISYSSANVDIRAWVLSNSEVIQNDVYQYTQGGSFLSQPVLISVFNLDNHIVVVETKDNTVAHGRIFYGAGSASQAEVGEPFGGTLYGYNQTHAVLWTPAASYGKPIYVDDIWGAGTDPLQISTVSIIVKVIATGAIPIQCPLPHTIANGFYEVSNDTASYYCNLGYIANQIDNIFHCNNTVWENVTLSCEEMRCPEPLNISNALHAATGNKNGSHVLYSCMPGYVADNGSRFIACNGSHWSETKLTCRESIPSSCGMPPKVINAFIEIQNNSAVTYHCHEGFKANHSSNTIHCYSGQWESPNLECTDSMCPSPVDIPNALSISEGHQNGSITLYSCITGYVPNDGSRQVTCNGTHWSSTQFTCLISSSCGLPPSIPNAYYEVENNTATYHCLPGYVGNGSNTIHCNGSVENPSSFACIVQSCPAAPVIPNSAMMSSGSNNGSVTVYACVSGFVANDGDPFISCNGTHWTTTSFSCSAISICESPPALQNGYYVMQNQTTAVYECLPGYIANDSNTAIYCRDFVWDKLDLSCNVISCPSPPVIANASMMTSGSTNGSVTVYACEPGFVSNNDNPFISCNGTHWTSTAFTCSASALCGPPPTVQNAYYVMTNQTTAVYKCFPGFIGSNLNTTIHCGDLGWDGLNLTCNDSSMLCPSPQTIPNAEMMYSGSTNGSVAVYACALGFISNGGSPFISCNGTHWTNTTFDCSASNVCGPPPSVQNAYYVLQNQTTAVYECVPGFIRNSSETVIHCTDFVWDAVNFTCMAQSCTPPPDIANAIKMTNGSLTIYACVTGFVANNEDPFISCNGTQWINTAFACSAVQSCPSPPDILNAVKISSGNLTIYSCETGFSANDEDHFISCDGTDWTETLFACSEKFCREPPEISNAVLLVDGYSIGRSALYSCIDGYTASGEGNSITCNGTHWTNTNFTCLVGSSYQPVCEPPPSVPNAYYEEVNNTATYYCFEGYTANGTDNKISCLDALWEKPRIQCLNASCTSPPVIPNAAMISSGQYNGSLTVYSCLMGFTASNEFNTIACNGSHWSDTNFSCSRDTSCQSPPEISNAVNISGGIIVGSLTMYSCLTGFTPSSEFNYITCNGSHWTDTNFTCSPDVSCPSPPEISNAVKISSGLNIGSLTVYSCLPGFTAGNEYNTITCDGTGWTETNYSCIPVPVACGIPPSIIHGYYTVIQDTATYRCLSGYTASNSDNTIHCVQSEWEILSMQCIEIENNITNYEMLTNKFQQLRIPRENISAHMRSLTCADDPRPSAKAIGGVGAGIICLVAGLLFLSDFVTLLKRRRIINKRRNSTVPSESLSETAENIDSEDTMENGNSEDA